MPLFHSLIRLFSYMARRNPQALSPVRYEKRIRANACALFAMDRLPPGCFGQAAAFLRPHITACFAALISCAQLFRTHRRCPFKMVLCYADVQRNHPFTSAVSLVLLKQSNHNTIFTARQRAFYTKMTRRLLLIITAFHLYQKASFQRS